MKNCTKARRGFTLVEIMIVIVIIGMLAGLVTINVRHYLSSAKASAARNEIASMKNAVETFSTRVGRFPTNDEGLDVLFKQSEHFSEPLMDGGGAPLDPWGNPYQYNCSGGDYEIISYGADNRPGGDGANADISSKQLKEKIKAR